MERGGTPTGSDLIKRRAQTLGSGLSANPRPAPEPRRLIAFKRPLGFKDVRHRQRTQSSQRSSGGMRHLGGPNSRSAQPPATARRTLVVVHRPPLRCPGRDAANVVGPSLSNGDRNESPIRSCVEKKRCIAGPGCEVRPGEQAWRAGWPPRLQNVQRARTGPGTGPSAHSCPERHTCLAQPCGIGMAGWVEMPPAGFEPALQP